MASTVLCREPMMKQNIETISEPDLHSVSGGSALSRCVAGASLLTPPATLYGAAAGTILPGVGTVTGAGAGALWGMAIGCAAGIGSRAR